MSKIIYDTHLHTEFSTDSKASVEGQIESAISKGLKGICITDHMDYGFPNDPTTMHIENPFTFDPEAYKKKLKELKERYSNFDLKIGVECGLQPYDDVIEKNKLLCSDPVLDQVIGSIHLVEKKDPYYPGFWEGRSAKDTIRLYLEATLKNIELFSDFDTMGHLDYAVRYCPQKGVYDPIDFIDIVDAIFEFLIKNDIALEINTSALKGDYAQVNPHPVLIKRYYEKGGRMMTVGADAHEPEHIAYGFDKANEILKEIGFKSYFIFDKRKPVEIGL